MLLLQMPSLRRKHGSLTTDSRESCLMMLFSLSVFRLWYISWLRSWRKWLTLGLKGLAGGPSAVPRPWDGLVAMASTQPLAKSRQQLQQSRPMGERQSSSDISSDRLRTRTDVWVLQDRRRTDERVKIKGKKSEWQNRYQGVFLSWETDRQPESRLHSWMVECQWKFLPEKCSPSRLLGPLQSLSSSASVACSLLFRADAGAVARC